MQQPFFKFYLENNCLKVVKIGTEDFTLIPLHRVSVSQLTILRDSKVAGFVLKKENRYYYADISAYKNNRISLENAPHQCASCARLSAASDKDGGCAKVRAFSRCIEQFAWINHGYETFGTKSDMFIVFHCLHWAESTHYPTHPITQQQKVMLAQFLWDNIDNYHDVRVMMEKANEEA